MQLSAYQQAEIAYLELLRLFPNGRKKSGKPRRITDRRDFFRTIGQVSTQCEGERVFASPQDIEVVEHGHLPITYIYQLHSFSDAGEDIFVASVVNPRTGEFAFLFNQGEEECIFPWLRQVLDHIFVDRMPPTRFLP